MPGPWVALCELYRNWRLPELALAVAEQGTTVVTGKPAIDIWYEVGMSNDDMRRNDQAIAAFTKALEIDPTHARSLFQRGQARFRAGKSADAKRDLEAFLAAPEGGNFAGPWQVSISAVQFVRRQVSSMHEFRSPQLSTASCCCAASAVPWLLQPCRHMGFVHCASHSSAICAQLMVPPPSGGGLTTLAAWLMQPISPTQMRVRHTDESVAPMRYERRRC
jgi:hypothetical protein